MTQFRRTTVSAPQDAIRTLEAEAQRRSVPLAALLANLEVPDLPIQRTHPLQALPSELRPDPRGASRAGADGATWRRVALRAVAPDILLAIEERLRLRLGLA
jgi:hypothetical protein